MRNTFSMWSNLRVLKQLLRLGVILRLDLVIVDEVLFHARVPVELEAGAIEAVFFLSASYIAYGHGMRFIGTVVRLRAADIGGCGWRAI